MKKGIAMTHSQKQQEVRLITVFFLFTVLFSCVREVKNYPDTPMDSGSISWHEPRKPLPKDPFSSVKEMQVLSNFIQTQPVTVTITNGKELILIGSARLTEIRPDPRLTLEKTDVYLLQIKDAGPDIQKFLKNKGVEIGYYIPDNTYIVRSSDQTLNWKSIPGFLSIAPYQPFLKISKTDTDLSSIHKVRISLWNEDETNWLIGYCKSNGIKVVSSVGKQAVVESSSLIPLLKEERVLKAEKYEEPQYFSLDGQKVVHAVMPFSVVSQDELPGNVSILDSGIDKRHPDISQSILQVYDIAGDNDTGEMKSHGTHLAGLIAGRGTLSYGKINGISPEAQLQFYAMEDSLLGLQIPASLSRILQNSLENQSKIVNMSFGTYSEDRQSRYLFISRDVDAFIYNHPEMIIVTAAGNDGKSIASPATAKNVIAVGALDGKAVAQYSGRGAAWDGRTKPDIFVQGSGLMSLDLNGGYTVGSGTSQSAAVVSGILSRLMPKLKKIFLVEPTFSVLKSILLASSDNKPDFGYGRLNSALSIDQKHYLIKRYEDIADFKDISVNAVKGDTLSIVLTWVDPPAFESSFYQLINDLDLEIQTPDGKVIALNDRLNPVEKIVLKNLQPGIYTVRISAHSQPYSIRDAALCVQSQLGFGIRAIETTDETAIPDSTGQDYTINQNYAPVPIGDNKNKESFRPDSMNNSKLEQGLSSPEAEIFQTKAFTASEETSADAEFRLEGLSEISQATSETSVLYAKAGYNTYLVRILGSQRVETMPAYFDIAGKKGPESMVPVMDSVQEHYQSLIAGLENSSNQVEGKLVLRNPSTGTTNNYPLVFSVDRFPPLIGARYPLNGGILTNSEAWITFTDSESGIDTNFILLLNGNPLPPSSLSYNFASGKLTLNIDKADLPHNASNIQIQFLKVADQTGNEIADTAWHFILGDKINHKAPEAPTGLSGFVSNRSVHLEWDLKPLETLKLAGYRIYKLSSDSLTKWAISDTVTTNHYNFTSRDIQNAGVSTLDIWSNESPLTLIHLDQFTGKYLPEVSISGVPTRTNKTVTAFITLKDEGVLVETNIFVNQKAVSANWNPTNGSILFDQSGNYELAVQITDDDTNTVTNTVSFEIGLELPESPQGLSWKADEQHIVLSWLTNSNLLKYNIYEGNTLLLSNNTGNQAFIRRSDYGSSPIGLSAVDSFGNESAISYVMADTELGIQTALDRPYYSERLLLNAFVKVSTNRYNKIFLSLSNRNTVRTWTKEAGHILHINEDIQTLPDGMYYFAITLFSNQNRLWDVGRFITNITIDHIAPTLLFSDGDQTMSGNYFLTKKDRIDVRAVDSNFRNLSISHQDGRKIDYIVPQAELILTNGIQGFRLTAEDHAGNWKTMNALMEQDAQPPVIQVQNITGKAIQGQIFDPNLVSYCIYTNSVLYYRSYLNQDGILSPFTGFSGNVLISAFDSAGNTNIFMTNVQILTAPTNQNYSLIINGYTNRYISNHTLFLEVTGGDTKDGPASYSVFEGGRLVFSSGEVYTSKCRFDGVPDGNYFVKANYQGKELDKMVVIDTIKPDIRIASLMTNPGNLGQAVLVSDKNLDRINFIVDNKLADTETFLEEGNHIIKAFAQDLAGNTEAVTQSVHVALFRTNYLTANFAFITNGGFYNTPIDISIQETNLTTARYFIFGHLWNSTHLNEEGTYPVSVIAESGGEYNQIYTNQALVTIDRTRPTVILGLSQNKIVSAIPDVRIWDENLLASVLRMDGYEWDNSVTGLTNGPHQISATAWDKAGNTNKASGDFILDKEPPLIAFIPQGGVYQPIQPMFAVADYALSNTQLWLNGKKIEQILPLTNEGSYEITVEAADFAGSYQSKTEIYTIDKTLPVITINVTNGQTCPTNFQIITKIEDKNLLTNEVFLDNKPYDGNPVKNKGRHNLIVRATDKAHNQSETSLLFTTTDETPAFFVKGLDKLPVYNGTQYANQKVTIAAGSGTGVLKEALIIVNGKHYTNIAEINTEGTYQIGIRLKAVLNSVTWEEKQEKLLVVDKMVPILALNVKDGYAYATNLSITPNIWDTNLSSYSIKLDGAEYHSEKISDAGEHNLSVKAADLALNQTETNIRFFIYDNLPGIVFDGLENTVLYQGRYYSDHKLNLFPVIQNGNGTISRITLNEQTLKGQAALGFDGDYTIRASGQVYLNDSVYQLEQVSKVTVDQVPPEIVLSGIKDGEHVQGPVNCTFIPDDNVIKTGYFLNGYEVESDSFSLSNDGDYILTAYCEDVLSRKARVMAKFTIDKLDTRVVMNGITNGDCYNKDKSYSVINTSPNITNVRAFENGVEIPLSGTITQNNRIDFKILKTDRSGKTSGRTIQFMLDKVSPLITFNSFTNGMCVQRFMSSIGIADQFLKNYEIFLYSADGHYTNWLQGTTNSTVDLSFLQDENDYFITVKSTDQAGGFSSIAKGFSIDRTAPLVQISGITNGGQYSAALTVGVSDTDTHRFVHSVWLDGSPLSLTTTNSAEYFTISNEGNHTLRLEATDRAGNITNLEYTFTLDYTPPQIYMSGITNGQYYPSRRDIKISYDATNVYQTQAADLVYLDSTESFYSRTDHFSASEEGIHKMTARAVDLAGNNTISNWLFTIDTIQPAIYFDYDPNGSYYNQSNKAIQVRVYDRNPGSTVVIADGMAFTPVSPGNWSPVITGHGAHTVNVMSIDLAGNTNCKTNNYILDTVSPTVRVTGLTANKIYYNTDRTIQVILADETRINPLICRIWIEKDGAEVWGVSGVTNGSYTATAEGEYRVCAKAVDFAGNVYEINSSHIDTVKFILDKTPPAVAFGPRGLADGNYVQAGEFSIRATDPGSTGRDGISRVEYSWDGENYYPDGNSTVSINGWNDGYYTVRARAFDLAENSSGTSMSFRKDTVGPVLSLSGGNAVGDRTPGIDYKIDVMYGLSQTFTAKAYDYWVMNAVLHVKVGGDSEFQIPMNAGTESTGSYTMNCSTVGTSLVNLWITAMDAASNYINSVTYKFQYTDSSYPTIEFSSGDSAFVLTRDDHKIWAKVKDNLGVNMVTCNGSEIYYNPNGDWFEAGTLTGADGQATPYELKLLARDAFNNITIKIKSGLIDKKKPTCSFDNYKCVIQDADSGIAEYEYCIYSGSVQNGGSYSTTKVIIPANQITKQPYEAFSSLSGGDGNGGWGLYWIRVKDRVGNEQTFYR